MGKKSKDKVKIHENQSKSKAGPRSNGTAATGKIYNFRVLIESEDEDVIREIEISDDNTFEDFHDAIKKAYNFSGKQMASFYISNEEWEKGQEIALVPIEVDERDDDEEDVKVMSDTKLKQLIKKPKAKLLYVFDFLLMWTFYIELMDISEAEKKIKYPRCTKKTGKAPSQNSKKVNDLNDEEEEMLKEFKGDSKSKDVFSDEIFEGFDDFDEGFNDLDDMDGFSELDKF